MSREFPQSDADWMAAVEAYLRQDAVDVQRLQNRTNQSNAELYGTQYLGDSTTTTTTTAGP